MCEFCESNQRILYQSNRYGNIYFDKFGEKTILVVVPTICPPHVDCSTKNMNIGISYAIDFCPNCGAKLI